MKKRILTVLLSVMMIIGGIVPVSAAKTNLAQIQGVSGRFLSIRGDYELATSANNIPANAWDGDASTYACAGGEWGYAFEVDLKEEYNVGEVALTFSQDKNKPTHYKIEVSTDGSNWTKVVNVEDNSSSDRRTHKFAAGSARYVKITDMKEYANVSQMHICELEIYESDLNDVFLTLSQPNDGEIGADNSLPVVINVGNTVSAAYLSGFKLMGVNGEVDCYKELGDGKVTLTPKTKLDGGAYTVTVQGTEMWSFTAANDNLTRTATARKVTPAEVELTSNYSGEFLPASNVIDGNTSTYASSEGSFTKYYMELDFGKPYENMNLARIYLANANGMGDIEVLVSNDARTWEELIVFPTEKKPQHDLWFPPTTARYMRFCILSTCGEPIFKEIDVLSIPNNDAPTAEIIANSKANGDIVVNFSDGMNFDTIAQGIKLKKGDAATPCKDRVNVECDFIAENSGRIIVRPKTGLDYGESYVLSVSDKIESIWGVPAEPTFADFVVEDAIDLEITTKSSGEYMNDEENSIYPAFVDNLQYQSWTEKGEKDYYDIKADGGKGPYTFAISEGALPDGLAMDSNGRISGTPTKEGEFAFTVKVTDAAGNTAEKQLTMESNPYRAKWFDDARFGIMAQSMGGGSYITKYGVEEGLKRYEEYVNSVFYPEKWAEQLNEMGARYFNYTAFGGDGIRRWPSKYKGSRGLRIERNTVTELLEALHKYDIKLMTYAAPDTTWTNSIELDPVTGGWYPVFREAVRELAQMGVDAVWCDMGMNAAEANWKEIAAIVRTENPYTLLVTNSGILSGGKVTNYPYTDIQNWEGNEAFNCPEDSRYYKDVYTAFKTPVRKKIGFETAIFAGPHWGASDPPKHGTMDFELKPVDELIESIQSNWDMGATYTMVYPLLPMSDGNLVHSLSKDGIDKITEWVKANIVPSNTPEASLESGTYKGEQTLELSGNGEIYYTTDGSIPSKESTLYTGPIKITDSAEIKAAAFEAGKGKSVIMHKSYVIEGKTEGCTKLTEEKLDVTIERPIVDTMSGMKIRVGKHPLKLRAIGRYATGDDGEEHMLMVKKSQTELDGPMLETTIDMSVGEADAQGFKYKEIAPVILEPFTNYIIVCEETSESTFANVSDFDNVYTECVNIVGGVITDENQVPHVGTELNGDISDKQQFLNLKFDVLPVEDGIDEKNIAIEARVKLLDNNGNECIPSSWTAYAINAIDNDLSTVAAAGYAWAWTLHVDLKKTYKGINEIIWYMGKEETQRGYATVYQIDVSNDNVNWTTVTYVDNNHSAGKKVFTYNKPFAARYVRLRSLKPDGEKQEGGQMQVAELAIHQTEEAFAQN